MKLCEILHEGEWSDDMSYDDRKEEFGRYRDEVEQILGQELPYEKIDIVRKAFLKGLESDEVADFLQSGSVPDRFQQNMDDEDMQDMSNFIPDEEFNNPDNFKDDEDTFDYTEYSMRQGEMGKNGRRR